MQSIIVYRSSPSQKAETVNFIKDHKAFGNPITAAVGDGGNDVNMIQSAHIGFGIQGNEGNAAASFSDYAITKYEDLKRLMFWHGRGFAFRASSFSMWFVYKGMLFSVPILLFNCDAGFSGLTYIPDWYFALYEVCLTTFAIFFYLLIDQDVSFNEADSLPFSIARLYSYKIRTHLDLKYIRFAGWTLYCWFTACVTYYIPFIALNDCVNSSGKTGGVFTNGFAAFSGVICVHHIMIAIFTRNWTFRLVLAYVISFSVFMPILALANANDPASQTYRNTFPDMLGGTPLYYLSTFLAVSIVALPLYGIKSYEMVIKAPAFYQKPKDEVVDELASASILQHDNAKLEKKSKRMSIWEWI